MQHLAPSPVRSSIQSADSTPGACAAEHFEYRRECPRPVAVAARRLTWASSTEIQGNWDGLLDNVLDRLKASVEGVSGSSELAVAAAEHGVKARVLECVGALEQLRHAMRLGNEQRPPGEREIQFPGAARARPVREPLEAGRATANRGTVSLDTPGVLPQPEMELRREMADYMAVVAHELRNPLVPIRTAAALLGQVRTEEIPHLQRIIERQVTRISGLIADLVDVARFESGKLRLQRQVMDMRAIVAEAVDDCRPAITARSQLLEIDMPPEAIEVDGDPGRLVQIVCNLLDNASKYTPVAGIVRVCLTRVGNDLSMIVSDDGIGIAPDLLPHLFERFVQESRATDFNRAGLGIGLAVVHELVEAHGGSVEARSEGPGRGSQFVVTLPRFVPVQGSARCA